MTISEQRNNGEALELAISGFGRRPHPSTTRVKVGKPPPANDADSLSRRCDDQDDGTGHNGGE